MVFAADQAENNSRPADRELLRRYLQGDQEAFAELVRRYRKPLFNFLYRFTGQTALADDLFQETFLQLHLSAATFDLSRRLKPWLFTIAANKARDAFRSQARRQAAPLDAVMNGAGDDRQSRYVELMPADIPQPDESLVNQETRQAVENIIREMPDNLRMVLLLNYFQGFAYKSIAELLGVPLGTVKSRLHAAVKHFAGKWKATSQRLGYDSGKSR